MNKAILNSLSEDETVLVMKTERARLVDLDEDALVDLHKRVRRARNKYVKLYRKHASSRVKEQGARGKARPKNARNAAKAEIFEAALARVSRRLSVAARQSSAALRAERLAAARLGKGSRGPAPELAEPGAPADRSAADRRVTTPAAKTRVSTSAAAGARRQAKKDTR